MAICRVDVTSHEATLECEDDGTDVSRALQITRIADEVRETRPRSPEDMINTIVTIAEEGGWRLRGDRGDATGDLQIHLTWVSGRKDFAVSVWDTRRSDVICLWDGQLKELTKGGRTESRMRDGARRLGVVDVTEEMIGTLSSLSKR